MAKSHHKKEHSHHEKMHGEHSARMPQEHFEHSKGQINPVCGEKYASEMGNPHDLDKAGEGLAGYLKSHKMKY